MMQHFNSRRRCPSWVSPASSQSVPVKAPPAAIPHVPPPGASLLMLPRRASPLRLPRRKDHGSLLGASRKGSWLSRIRLSYVATAYPLRRLVRLSPNPLRSSKLFRVTLPNGNDNTAGFQPWLPGEVQCLRLRISTGFQPNAVGASVKAAMRKAKRGCYTKASSQRPGRNRCKQFIIRTANGIAGFQPKHFELKDAF